MSECQPGPRNKPPGYFLREERRCLSLDQSTQDCRHYPAIRKNARVYYLTEPIKISKYYGWSEIETAGISIMTGVIIMSAANNNNGS